MYKKDDSNTDKYQFKPTKSDFVRELNHKFLNIVQQWHGISP